MDINISDLEKLSFYPTINTTENGYELIFFTHGNFTSANDIDKNTAFIHPVRNFYLPHGRVRIIEFGQLYYQMRLQLPAGVERVVLGEDYYTTSGIFRREDDAVSLYEIDDTVDYTKPIPLLSPSEISIADVVERMPVKHIPPVSGSVKYGSVIFRAFPSAWPPKELVVEEIESPSKDKFKAILRTL